VKVTVRPLTPERSADLAAGFAEAARRRPARPVVRLALRAD
jgi:hypothetical protein